METPGHVPEHYPGRADTIAAVVQSLTEDGTYGALIVGEPGLGKSTVGRLALSQLGNGVRLLRVTGNATLSNIPFSVLGPFLRDLPLDREASPLVVQRTMLAYLGITTMGPHPEPMPLFVVDDAHTVDESSCELLVQLAVAGMIKLLVLSRAAPAPPSAFLSLWHDGLLSRHDLESLTADEVHEVCALELGGEVTAAVSTVLAEVSAGNPMFLHHLLDQGRRLGRIVRRHGVWLLVGEPPGPGINLMDLVRSQLRRRTAQELEALELIALAGPIEQNVLFSLAEGSVLDGLHADGLIRYRYPEEAMADIGHPVYGEVLRAGIPASRSFRLREKFLQAMGSRTAPLDRVFRHVAWGLDCGAPLDDVDLIRAAVMANRLYHPEFALRAIAAIRGGQHREQALIQQIRALIMQENLGFARSIADELLAVTSDARIAMAVVTLGADIRLRAGEPAESLGELAAAWERTLLRIRETAHPDDMPIVERRLRLGVKTLRAYQANLEGQFQKTAGSLQDIVDDPDCIDELRIVALALLCESLGSTGRAVQGLRTGQEALQLITAHGNRFAAYLDFVFIRTSMAMVMTGQWQELRSAAEDHVRSTPRGVIYLGGAADLLSGLVHLRQGRARPALHSLRLAVESLRQSDVAQLLPLATGVALYAAFLDGDTATVEDYRRSLAELDTLGSKRNWLLASACATAARSGDQGVTASIRDLHAIAGTARGMGAAAVESLALELAFHLGDRDCLVPLASVAGRTEGPEAAVVHMVAGAFNRGEPNGLIAASRQADDAGYVLFAAECLLEAIAVLERRGEGQRARALRADLGRLEKRLDGTQVPRLGVNRTTAVLTRRERDIAQLAGQGHSNREIAERLGVAVRTVEGHLYRIFGKLGVSRREELDI